jgi:Gas vesicle protein
VTEGNVVQPRAEAAQLYGTATAGSAHTSTSLGDILERVLDKGLVIAGDIQVNLLDIELLTIKLRLVIASLDTAREAGINWWEDDPWLSARASRRADERELRDENRRLRRRISQLETSQESEPKAELEADGERASRRRDND